MNHSIHNLAAMPINAAAAFNNAATTNKKHQQQQFLMHNNNTIQQPLVNQQRQQTLQFHHQTLYHPYSTLQSSLHHQNLSSSSSTNQSTPPSGASGNTNNNQFSSHSQLMQHFASSQPTNQLNSSSIMQQQQPQYNMNSSDYSSSTYHIYDQISDLIIIKQQRMERKRQQEQKRKVILFTLAAILLVGSLLFLLLQSLFASNNSSSSSTTSNLPTVQPNNQQQQQFQEFLEKSSSSSSPRFKPSMDPISISPPLMSGGNFWMPSVAPPLAGPNRFQQAQILNFQQTPPFATNIATPQQFKPLLQQQQQQQQQQQYQQRASSVIQPLQQQPVPPMQVQQQQAVAIQNQLPVSSMDNMSSSNLNKTAMATSKVIDSCGEHGTLVVASSGELAQCKCDFGFAGDQCQIAISLPPAISNLQPNLMNNMKLLQRCQASGCSGNGQCNMQGKCDCNVGFFGDDCNQPIERQCDDGIDNDRDGLVDCADSECCSDKFCQNSTLCMKSPDPLDILMRKQPPPPTSSFFQRMQFLIEKFSSQYYSHPKDFNDSRASVIRGRVTYLKQGVTGVRVSVAGQHTLGVALTRDGGYFDLMVNGGGAVVIEFRREPFATHQKSVRVPWNEIVLIEPIELSLDSSSDLSSSSSARPTTTPSSLLPEADAPTCMAHNYRFMRPLIVTAPRSSRRSNSISRQQQQQQRPTSTSRAVILQDSALVQQSILLPGSSNAPQEAGANLNESVSLVYISNRANEFMSTINIQLLPSNFLDSYNQPAASSKVPDELRLIHLKIIIEGNLFEQVFEPQANLTFTYAWNRRNVYKQKCYGLSTALVSVGYEYEDCRQVIWTSKQVRLPGHDLSISDIGQQWNLNIHHRYNYRDSILQRGDGLNFNLKTDKPKIVQPIMGDGYQRQASCPYCDGATSNVEQRLLKPQALVSAPDGSLYVGDFNLIRRVEFAPGTGSSAGSQQQQQSVGSGKSDLHQSGRKTIVRTILELPTTRVPSKYGLALNLADNKLYMSDVDRYQIYLIREQQAVGGAAINRLDLNESLPSSSSMASDDSLLPVVGSGIKCQLDDRSNCGDGQSAKNARLIEPKALAFDLANRMYIADGPNVRMVDTDGKIYTILGNYAPVRHTKFPCSGEAIPMHKFVPKNPLDLALSPIDDTLHILDDNVVYKITQDKRVQIVAGKLAHCLQNNQQQQTESVRKLRATEVFLQSAQSISFSQNGDLFISEDDQKQLISRVLLVSPEEDSITLYAGLPIDSSVLKSSVPLPTVDANSLVEAIEQQESLQADKQRSSNLLPVSQVAKASEYKFNSIAAIAVDQLGRLIVADKMQLRIVSIEPDLPRMNSAGEYELQSPDNADELLIFNRFGHHIATRELPTNGQNNQRQANKYTFQYNVNTSFGQLSSVSYASGNKMTIYRDGPQHSVKMIETAFGGQCKFDISRSGQVHSISTTAPNTTKTNFSYHVDGGLLKQSRDQASGELFEFQYDEFGRAVEIIHSSAKLAPVECRFSPSQRLSYNYLACNNLIVAE